MNRKQRSNIFQLSITSILMCFCLGFANHNEVVHSTGEKVITSSTNKNAFISIYQELELESLGLSKKAFEYAITGYSKLLESGEILNDAILSVVDFSLPSNQKRFFVIDLNKGALLYHTFVSHGKNSGKLMAQKFSNRFNSYQSSIGFYTTGETYIGKHGVSLRLLGKERGINDKALERGIVIHSAAYADESVANQQGYLGRSLGCPAIPEKIHKEVIETIQNGSCFFIYAPIPIYPKQSKLV